ncbi:HypC/HybG/HupF family hydrogenase formation chaperone [Rhodovulum sp. P5]|uniref:HypC/HybG/HupF family hydrogenase formation chaperone n=1 Tax=Rhodovulum sp. P5 TaxID=1564506 RepID=UPI0021110E8A|nr:HypC/HybG/HupF family hydrogenase formation chaperone [Rhodovulum sp. P5]
MGIPMRVVKVDGLTAKCEAKGICRDVSLWMLQHETVAPGDHLLTHLDNAVRKITEDEARETWALLDLVLTASGPAQPA